ncbi:cell wall anchor protein [Mesorhizobium amorphae]|uniref:cell wall anchor protein n=1 Tax=Mesorhizobium amorphae TaxID=71433 RepID=UPI001186EC99|nr:cell wall anchor protein [Mesorhizobium amorphae]
MRLLLAAAATLSLAGCQTVKLDEDIQKNLPAICSNAATAHQIYSLAVAAGKVSPANQRKADAAWTSLEVICADPGKQTAQSVIIQAFAAYLAITAASR